MRKRTLHTCLAAALLMTTSAQGADLLEIYEQALSSDPQLRAAAAQRNSSGEITRLAYANFLPQASGSASYTESEGSFETFSGDTGDSDTSRENIQIGVDQTIYNRSNYAQLDAARAQVSQANADYTEALQAFQVRVAERYFGVLTAEDALTFAEAELKANERQLEQADQRYEVGLTAITDVYEARASFDGARARVIQARNTMDDAKEALAELTGADVGGLTHLAEQINLQPPPEDSASWVDTALNNNPTLVSAQHAVTAAEAEIERQRAGHWPSVSASFGYSDTTNDGDLGPFSTRTQDGTSVSLTVNVPIFSGGAVSARSRQAAFDYEAALERREQQRRATVRQARNAYRAVIAGISEVEARQQAVLSAEKALEATEAGFEVGTRTIVDVLLSQRTLFSAQSEYSRARHNLILEQLRLKQASGTINRDDLEIVNRLLR